MEDETKRKIRAMAEFVLENLDPTTKDLERIKKDPDTKSQMQKRMGGGDMTLYPVFFSTPIRKYAI